MQRRTPATTAAVDKIKNEKRGGTNNNVCNKRTNGY